MKATIEIPEELYRQVKAKSALEGRAIREVTEELYRRYVSQEEAEDTATAGGGDERKLVDDEPAPPWFGVLGKRARRVKRHDMAAIRASIAKGISRDRKL